MPSLSEAQLRAHLASIVESSEDAIVSKDLNGIVTSWNRGAESIFGYRAEEMIGQPILRLIPPEQPDEEPGILARIRRGERVEHYETVRVRKDGGRIDISLTISPIRDETGRIVGASKIARDITPRKQAEQALRESQQRFAAFMSHWPGAAWIKDASGRYLYANLQAERVFSRSWTDLQGRTDDEVFPPETARQFRLNDQRVLSGESSIQTVEVLRQADGLDHYSLVSKFALPGPDGAPSLVGGVAFDITDRLRAEQALRESREQLALAMSAGRMGSWNWDLRTGRANGSPESAALLGFPSTEFPSTPEHWRRHVHPEDWPVLEAALRPPDDPRVDYEATFRVCWPDGSLHWLQARGRYRCDDAGQPVELSGVMFDLSALKEAEAGLLRRERIYRAIGESIDYGIWVCDPDGRNTYASESFLKLVGLTQAECSEFGWGRVLHPDDAEATIAAWKECTHTGSFWEREHRFLGVDGQWHPILARGVPIRDDTGAIVCWAGINLDIAALKRTEQALRESEQQLREQAALLENTVQARTASLRDTIAELEAFSYSITHDLRAPLRAMQGFAQCLEEDCGETVGAPGKEYIRRIIASANRMDRLIQDVLAYSRVVRTELSLSSVDLDKLVRGILESYPDLRTAGARIELAGRLPRVLGNEAALTQCVSNLLGNAVKFVAPGVIPQVRLRAESHEGHARLWIEDNGIGIEREHWQRIFQMFQRLHKHYEGTGIGLAIVQKAVERMGGTLGLDSVPGQGSRFWIQLPTAD